MHGEEAHRFFSISVSPSLSLTLRANTRHCNASDVKTWFFSSMLCAAPVSHGTASHCCFCTNQQHVKCNIFITFFCFKALWILKFFWLSLETQRAKHVYFLLSQLFMIYSVKTNVFSTWLVDLMVKAMSVFLVSKDSMPHSFYCLAHFPLNTALLKRRTSSTIDEYHINDIWKV